MNYVLLIYQGSTPVPTLPEAWATLSEAEQKTIYADYAAVNKTPGVTPGLPLGLPEGATRWSWCRNASTSSWRVARERTHNLVRLPGTSEDRHHRREAYLRAAGTSTLATRTEFSADTAGLNARGAAPRVTAIAAARSFQ
jgi:hypothetical protein